MLKRNKRRQEEKQMAVINPMRNAKRRLRISAKNRANKKRKIMKLKEETFRAGIKSMRNPKRKLRISAENHANKKRKNL